jgi:hypothetical protein
MGMERDAAHHDDVLVTANVLENPFQMGERILEIAGIKLFECLGDPSGRVLQALALRIVAGPGNKGADCGFRFLTAWARELIGSLALEFLADLLEDCVHLDPRYLALVTRHTLIS